MKTPLQVLCQLEKDYCLSHEDKEILLFDFVFAHTELWEEFEEFCHKEVAEWTL